MDHQTQISFSILNDSLAPNSESENELNKSPEIIYRTPPTKDPVPNKRSRTKSKTKRDLLPQFCQEKRFSQSPQEDLANEIPRWMERAREEGRSGSHSSLGQSSKNSTPSSGHGYRSTPSGYSTGRDISSTPESSFDEGVLKQILSEVKASNGILKDKLTKLEQKVSELQDDVDPPARKKRKLTPSREVRDVVRKVYRSLVDGDENFGWNLHEPLQSIDNEQVTQKLISESKRQLPDTASVLIKEAAKTYFNSMNMSQRLKTSGKYKDKCVQQRRRNRLNRKLKARKVALQKTSAIPKSEKGKWLECLVPELMSSEESEASDSDYSFKIRPLLWRDEKVNRLVASLDNKSDKRKSKKSKIMTFKRTEGLPSDRPVPDSRSVPSWTIKA